MSSESLRFVVMDTCAECNGEGTYHRRNDDDTGLEDVACEDCKGEGVAERQITIRELRRLLEADAAAEKAEMDAGRFEEVSKEVAAEEPRYAAHHLGGNGFVVFDRTVGRYIRRGNTDKILYFKTSSLAQRLAAKLNAAEGVDQ
jgi:hypothetical protein